MTTASQFVDMRNLSIGTLMRTRSMRIGLFTGVSENDTHPQWQQMKEIPITGSFIVLSNLFAWSNGIQGYKVLSSFGTSWLIWSDNSKFGQNPEQFVELIT